MGCSSIRTHLPATPADSSAIKVSIRNHTHLISTVMCNPSEKNFHHESEACVIFLFQSKGLTRFEHTMIYGAFTITGQVIHFNSTH
mmetsp:Transcript_13637/g.28879  ORF Transcript_13637/g.28879 Transcript_13637/m.28879 type:complete len:86 (+) Transcript_13637:229-486(+)